MSGAALAMTLLALIWTAQSIAVLFHPESSSMLSLFYFLLALIAANGAGLAQSTWNRDR